MKECDIVFIAVPTPSTPKGFDYSIVESVLACRKRETAVIKSTILPGRPSGYRKASSYFRSTHRSFCARRRRRMMPRIRTETLSAFPKRHPTVASEPSVMRILPRAEFERLCTRETRNSSNTEETFLYFKVIFTNLLYDLSSVAGINWKDVRDAVAADPRIGASHMEPIHPADTPRQGRPRSRRTLFHQRFRGVRVSRAGARDPLE